MCAPRNEVKHHEGISPLVAIRVNKGHNWNLIPSSQSYNCDPFFDGLLVIEFQDIAKILSVYLPINSSIIDNYQWIDDTGLLAIEYKNQQQLAMLVDKEGEIRPLRILYQESSWLLPKWSVSTAELSTRIEMTTLKSTYHQSVTFSPR